MTNASRCFGFCIFIISAVSGSKPDIRGTESQGRSCVLQREESLRESQEIAEKLPGKVTNVTTIMIPQCKEDGSWEEVGQHKNPQLYRPIILLLTEKPGSLAVNS